MRRGRQDHEATESAGDAVVRGGLAKAGPAGSGARLEVPRVHRRAQERQAVPGTVDGRSASRREQRQHQASPSQRPSPDAERPREQDRPHRRRSRSSARSAYRQAPHASAGTGCGEHAGATPVGAGRKGTGVDRTSTGTDVRDCPSPRLRSESQASWAHAPRLTPRGEAPIGGSTALKMALSKMTGSTHPPTLWTVTFP